MHKVSIDLIVDQPRQPKSNTTSEQLSLLIEWVVTLALHTHFDLVECDSVSAIALFAELRNGPVTLLAN